MSFGAFVNSKRLSAFALVSFIFILPACGKKLKLIGFGPGENGYGTGNGGGTGISGQAGPGGALGLTTQNLLVHYDAAKARRGSDPGICGAASWWDLGVSAFDASLYGFPTAGCVVTSGFGGLGTPASPYYLAFDGVDDFARIGQRDLGNGDRLTLEFRVMLAATQKASATLISKHASGSTGFTIEQAGATVNQYYFAYGDGTTWHGTTKTLTLQAGKWLHYVVVKDGATVTHYVNGVSALSYNNASAVMAKNTVNLDIGDIGTHDYDRFAKMNLATLRIYAAALTMDQVRGNCEVDKARFANTTCQ